MSPGVTPKDRFDCIFLDIQEFYKISELEILGVDSILKFEQADFVSNVFVSQLCWQNNRQCRP